LKRSAKELAIIQRRIVEAKRMDRRFTSGERSPERYAGGNFRKRDPYDCGRTRCLCCHGEKVLGIRSHQQRLADAVASEQLKDLD
jgi:hypothetical protein